MNPLAALLLTACAVALLFLPRRWAVLAFLVGTCYVSKNQAIDLVGVRFDAMRVLVAVGFLRILIRRERLPGGLIGLDRAMILWAVWACISSAFHTDPRHDLIFKLGLSYDACGVYFLTRVFCNSWSDILALGRSIMVTLFPIAATMIYEQATMHNLFFVLGHIHDTSMIRDGRIRAFGPFLHPILAGTVGAVAMPFLILLWRRHKITAGLGLLACLAIIGCSASSGPVMSAVAGLLALIAWRWRHQMRVFQWGALASYVALDIVMNDPAYYIITRLDVTGSSTGWHRARLIESSIIHLNEWWLAGTDYTRHWMPTGVSWNPQHTDITNHYLQMGVLGGLPLMLIFILTIVIGFNYVGNTVKQTPQADPQVQYGAWVLGAILFSQATTMVSVSYFDQSIVFFYLILAVIASGTRQGLVTGPSQTRLMAIYGPRDKFVPRLATTR